MTDRHRPRITLGKMNMQQAHEWATECAERIAKTPNYTGSDETFGTTKYYRFYAGYRGELAALDWMCSQGWDVEFKLNTSGRSQGSEFIVTVGDRRLRIEIKTAGQPHHKKIMIPENAKLDFDIVIGQKLVAENVVEIWGWFGRREIEAVMPIEMVKVDTRACLLDNMRGLDELIATMARLQARIPKEKRVDPAKQTVSEWLADYDAAGPA